MKNLLSATSVLLLSMSAAMAGGGGGASNSCFYTQMAVLKKCESETLKVEVLKVKFWNFAETGTRCPRGGEIVKITDVELKSKVLGIDTISNPSTRLEENTPVETSSRGGLVLNDLQETNGDIFISTTVNAQWSPALGRSFVETAKCN